MDINLKDVLRSAAASVAGTPVDILNALLPAAAQIPIGSSEAIKADLGGKNMTKDSAITGELVATFLPAGAISKSALATLKDAKNLNEVMSSIRKEDIGTIKNAVANTLARQDMIHSGQMDRLKEVSDWIQANHKPSGYNSMPGVPFRTTKDSVPDRGVLVSHPQFDIANQQSFDNSISSTPKVWLDIQKGLNNAHAEDAAMKLQNADTGHLYQRAQAPVSDLSAKALPFDSKISSLLYDLQQKKAYGNNQIAIDAMKEALRSGLIK